MITPFDDDELRRAAALGDAKTVRKLLKAGHAPADMDNAALRRALRHGHSNIVKLLLKAGANFIENTEEFLRLAAQNRNAQSLKMLLRSVKAVLPHSVLNQVLFAAIKTGNTQAVSVLIAAGAEPRAGENHPARLAATAGSVQILQILRRHGADFNARDGEILGNAVSGGHLDAVRYILTCGVDVNARAHMAITVAAVAGDSEMLETLLLAGGTLQHPYLITDVTVRDSMECLLILIRRGCEFTRYADDLGMNAVRHCAARILKYVYDHSSISQRARDLQLQVAADKAEENILNFLLEHGANPAADRSEALQRAARAQKTGNAEKLIGAGACVSDLDAAALVAWIKAGNWPFLVHLLHHSLTVKAVILSADHAAKFFHQITPQDFLQDSNGRLLPGIIRKERYQFARVNGSTAAQINAVEAKFVCRWISDFLRIQRGHD